MPKLIFSVSWKSFFLGSALVLSPSAFAHSENDCQTRIQSSLKVKDVKNITRDSFKEKKYSYQVKVSLHSLNDKIFEIKKTDNGYWVSSSNSVFKSAKANSYQEALDRLPQQAEMYFSEAEITLPEQNNKKVSLYYDKVGFQQVSIPQLGVCERREKDFYCGCLRTK